MKKRTARILTIVAAIILALGVVYAVAVTVSAAKLRRAYAEIDKAGRPMQAADIIPPGIPDSENAALLYESATLLLKAQPTVQGSLLDHLGKLCDSFLQGSIEPNGLTELRELIQHEAVSQALSILEQGTRRPLCRFERDYEDGLQMKLHRLADLRHVSWILGTKARFEAEAGRSIPAWELANTQLKFADALRQEPIIISQLVRSTMIRQSCGTIQETSRSAPPDKQRSETLDGLLQDLDDDCPLVLAIDGERLLVGEWLYNMPRRELRKILRKEVYDSPYMPDLFYWAIFHRVTLRPSFLADHAVYLRAMHRSAHIVQGIDSHDDNGEPAPGKYKLSSVLIVATGRIRQIHLDTTARIRITRAGLALLQYKQVHGAFPPALDALGLEQLVDPFTDQPLHYRADGEGFVVYSLAADRKDNGGSPKKPKQDTDSDIVWRFPGEQAS